MKKTNNTSQQGFTLIELMIVVVIISILTAIAVPSYKQHVMKTKRTDMMTHMKEIESYIESSKLAKSTYADVDISGYGGDYKSLYTVSITSPLDSSWMITAIPVTTGAMSGDGVLALNFEGRKCKGTTCGYAKEWNE